jgi:hypothetical protein
VLALRKNVKTYKVCFKSTIKYKNICIFLLAHQPCLALVLLFYWCFQVTHTHSHTLSHTHTLTQTHTHTHTHSFTHTYTHTHSHSHIHTLARTHSLSLSHTLSHIHSHTHTHIHSHTHTHTHTLFHTHSHTHTVGLLCKTDPLVAENYTWQHKTLTRDRQTDRQTDRPTPPQEFFCIRLYCVLYPYLVFVLIALYICLLSLLTI